MAGRKDRRIEMLEQAARVFMRNGYRATTMNLVAEQAQVTKPGLYYHFEGKQHLLYSIIDHSMTLLERAVREATLDSRSSEERLRKIFASHARLITHEKEGALTVLVIDMVKDLQPEDRRRINERKRAYFELVRALIRQLESEGALRPGFDSTLVSFGLLGMVMWIAKWYRPDGALSSEEVVDQITELAVGAILGNDRQEA